MVTSTDLFGRRMHKHKISLRNDYPFALHSECVCVCGVCVWCVCVCVCVCRGGWPLGDFHSISRNAAACPPTPVEDTPKPRSVAA